MLKVTACTRLLPMIFIYFHFLRDPYVAHGGGQDDGTVPLKPMKIDIDLGLSAYANSRK